MGARGQPLHQVTRGNQGITRRVAAMRCKPLKQTAGLEKIHVPIVPKPETAPQGARGRVPYAPLEPWHHLAPNGLQEPVGVWRQHEEIELPGAVPLHLFQSAHDRVCRPGDEEPLRQEVR